MFTHITATHHERAFSAFTLEYVTLDLAARENYETIFGQAYGMTFLEDWRAWRRAGYRPARL